MTKPGPKPSKDGSPKRRSIAITDELWQWCEQQAVKLGFKSTSAYISDVLKKAKNVKDYND